MFRLTTFPIASLFAVLMAASASAVEKVDFNRDVRPILSDKCFQCHGPDENTRESELRLDEQSSALSKLSSDVVAIVPHKPQESEVIQRVSSADPDLRMPPSDAGKQLSKIEIEVLTRWVSEGAEWGKHWSFVAPKRPPLPRVRDRNWPENSVDHFVLAKLEKSSWEPAPRADKRTLIRRASLAATGLPPAPRQVHTFLADRSVDAYERLIDRLLQSPTFGEHQTRYWLDLARYGRYPWLAPRQ